ncbi:unnamed protein product, partial [marine sediment metagenome]
MAFKIAFRMPSYGEMKAKKTWAVIAEEVSVGTYHRARYSPSPATFW